MDEVVFGRTLKKLRVAKGLSQEELAFRAKLHRTYVSQLERGEKSPSLKTIDRLARALDLKPSALLLKVERFSS